MSYIIFGYVPFTPGNRAIPVFGEVCKDLENSAFRQMTVPASHKNWKGNSEMHLLWKQSQGITRRHRKAHPASKGVCHTLPCLSPFIPPV